MCGIFGAIGNWSEGTVRALAITNRERGKDSLGFFDSSGQLIKGAGDPLAVMAKPHISSWLRGERKKCVNRVPKGWFIAGHTRLGTRGAAVRRNAHPFRYGRIVGAHNGMVDAPRDYEVDSMYLFDLLDRADNDYNKALAEVTGYWGMSWYDGKDFYLQCHDGELSMVHTEDCWYYSSDDDHLKACVQCDHEKIQTFGEGETWKFSSDGTVAKIDAFVSQAAQYWTKGGQYNRYWSEKDYETSSYRSGASMGGTEKWWNDKEYTATDENVRDFDEDWRKAWSAYTEQSEHSKV
jgi:hypothetical protein